MANSPRCARDCRAFFVINECGYSDNVIGLKRVLGSKNTPDQESSTDSSDE